MGYVEVGWFTSKEWIFCLFLILIFNLTICCQRKYFIWFQLFENLSSLFKGVFWKMFHFYLKTVYALQLLDVVTYKCQVNLVEKVNFGWKVFILLNTENGVSQSLAIMWVCLSPSSYFFSLCNLKFCYWSIDI